MTNAIKYCINIQVVALGEDMNIQESIGELPETCRAVIKRKDGHIVGVRVLTDDERIASLMAFLELAEIAGYTITPLTRKTRYNIGAGLNTRHHFLNTAAPHGVNHGAAFIYQGIRRFANTRDTRHATLVD